MFNKMKSFVLKATGAIALFASSHSVMAQQAITDTGECAEGTLGGIACNLRQQLGDFAALVIGLFYLIGFGLTGLGIYFFWKNEQQPNQDHGKKGLIAVLVGGGLISLIYIIEASSASIVGEQINANDMVSGDVGDGF